MNFTHEVCRASLAVFVLLSSGCTASLGFGGADEESSGDRGAGDGDSVSGTDSPTDCAIPVLGSRLLTTRQYEHTVIDLLGVGGGAAADDPRQGAAVSYSLARVDELGAEVFDEKAAGVAAAVSADLTAHLSCAPGAASSDPCASQLIADFGKRAYRRALTDSELSELKTLYDAGAQEGGATAGVDFLVTGVLQSPDFLYRLALTSAEESGTTTPLDGYTLASRLSYFLWDSMPDGELFTAAEAGTLNRDETLFTEVVRMMEDPKFDRSVRVFFNHFLGMGSYADVSRDVWSESGIDVGQSIIASLRESVRLQIAQLYSTSAPRFDELFSGSVYYMDDTLKDFYGVSGSETASLGIFEPVDLGHEGRRGIVTHPALMTAMARPDATFPIARGLFVVENLFCQHLEVPESIDIPPLGPIPEGGTERDQLELHNADPACASCHSVMDPPGFAFQSFDEVGRLRSIPIGEDEGVIVGGGDLDGPFGSGVEFFDRIGGSHTARQCFAKHYFEFALARPVVDESLGFSDECSLEPIFEDFNTTGDLKELIRRIIASDAFRSRLHQLAEGGE